MQNIYPIKLDRKICNVCYVKIQFFSKQGQQNLQQFLLKYMYDDL